MADMGRNQARGKRVSNPSSPEDEDFLAEIVAERTAKDPRFPQLVDAALRRRELIWALAAKRDELKLSQQAVAKRMGTSQSAVARLEAGELDAKLSTIERFAMAVGQKIIWRLTSEHTTSGEARAAEVAGSGRAARTRV